MPKTRIPIGNPNHLKTQPEHLWEHPPVIAWIKAFRDNFPFAQQHHQDAFLILRWIGDNPHTLAAGVMATALGPNLGIGPGRVDVAMGLVVSKLGVCRQVITPSKRGQTFGTWISHRPQAGRDARLKRIAAQAGVGTVSKRDAAQAARQGVLSHLRSLASGPVSEADLDALVDSILPKELKA